MPGTPPEASRQIKTERKRDRQEGKYARQRTLSAPRVVARLEAQRAVLEVAAANANRVDLVRAELGHRRRTSNLILALLLVNVAATTGEAALVSGVTANACDGEGWGARDETDQ